MIVPGIRFVQGINNYSDADGKKYGIAVHNTSNDASDSGEASYATWRPDGTSAHLYADRDSITQSLDTARKAGHAGSSNGNENAIALEITGGNGMSRSWWLANVCWDELGRVLALIIKHHWPDGSFQVRRASVAEMRANAKVKAFYGHNDMRLAWGGTTHTDPGDNFPWDKLFAVVNAALGKPAGPAATEEDDMRWFAKADREGFPGKFWLGDAWKRRLVDLGEKNQLSYVGYSLAEGLNPPPKGILMDINGNISCRANCDGMGPVEVTLPDFLAAVRAVVGESDDIEIDAEDVAARVDAKLAARLAS